MIEDMQLRGLADKTQDAYLRAVRQLAEYYGKSPDQVSEEELRQDFLYLRNEKEAARSTCLVAVNDDNKGKRRYCTLPVEAFIRRFLVTTQTSDRVWRRPEI